MRTLVEARCPSSKCSKVHHVIAVNGEITQDAMCPPSTAHRRWVTMTPGRAQVESAKARRS